MEYSIHPISDEDGKAVLDIFNHYIENSFAAYPDKKFPYQAMDTLLGCSNGLPAGTIKNRQGRVAGFGMLRLYNPLPAFSKTAEVTYFLHPDFTGKGLGSMLLADLETRAKAGGIRTLLANISSLNPGSIDFHRKNGFTECGRFLRIGEKKDRTFDVVWMQKRI